MNSSNLREIAYCSKDITFITLESIISILATIGNGLVIFAFAKEPKLRRRSNFYIISLACADFLVGLIGIPFGILTNFLKYKKFVLSTCVYRVSFLFSFCNISINSLVLISIKRYIILSVNAPHGFKLKFKTAAIEIGFCWIIGIVFGLSSIFKHKEAVNNYCHAKDVINEYHAIIRLGVLICFFVLLTFIYYKIYKIILKQTTNEQKLKPYMEQKKLRIMRREVRMTITIAMIVVLFIIGWIPLNIVYAINIFCRSCKPGRGIYYICIICAHSISALNPILYAYNMKDVRKVMFDLKNQSFESSLVETKWYTAEMSKVNS